MLLENDYEVYGIDAFTDYYDVNLKKSRQKILLNFSNYNSAECLLEDFETIKKIFDEFQPDFIIHLAAQAGVRYSLKNPRTYINTNIIGTFNIIELAREYGTKHLLIASTSSIYGANQKIPFQEIDKTDNQLTIYAATKKACESMAHSYSYLWNLPITIFRFFTVYGPWGRPDMSYFKFVNAILNNKKIDIYNNGQMYRDFTYIDDLVNSINQLIHKIPETNKKIISSDSVSSVAPFRVINIGNSQKIKLMDFIEEIENQLGKSAMRNYIETQMGDMESTWADTSLLQSLIDDVRHTNFREGLGNFIKWYKNFYNYE